jgi:hypothetical protein
MGNLYSYNQIIKVCDDYIGNKKFSIHIKIHCTETVNLAEIAEYLQHWKPISIEVSEKIIILHFNDKVQSNTLISDISGEIISCVVSDITKHCIENSICSPYYVEASIYTIYS